MFFKTTRPETLTAPNWRWGFSILINPEVENALKCTACRLERVFWLFFEIIFSIYIQKFLINAGKGRCISVSQESLLFHFISLLNELQKKSLKCFFSDWSFRIHQKKTKKKKEKRNLKTRIFFEVIFKSQLLLFSTSLIVFFVRNRLK